MLYSYFAITFLLIAWFNFMLIVLSLLKAPLFITKLLFKIELIIGLIVVIAIGCFKLI